MFVRFSSLVAVLLALVLVPLPVSAQQTTSGANRAGPRLELTATAMQPVTAKQPLATADSAETAALQRRQSMGRPVAMMVVGGAAVILGAVIGDAPGTLFMIGGAIAFLYGLYQYLK